MRKRLVSEALELYLKEGLEALSFRRLAEASGISHTLPYRYFDGKEALLVAIRVECTERFDRMVREQDDASVGPLDRIERVAFAYVDFVQESPGEYQMMFSTHQPPPDQFPELLAARRRLFEHAVEIVQAAIDRGLLQGSARELTHLFWVSFHGLMTLHVAGQLVHGCELRELVTPLLSRLLGESGKAAARTKASQAGRRPLSLRGSR
jgi:AcrR family transcriptional regulator